MHRNDLAQGSGRCSRLTALGQSTQRALVGSFCALGYRVGEVCLPEIPQPEPNATLTVRPHANAVGAWRCKPRKVVQRNIILFHDIAPVMPDSYDPETMKSGVRYRMMRERQPMNRHEKNLFREFVRVWIRANLKPLRRDQFLNFEAWLATTSYTDQQKRQMRKAHDEATLGGNHPIYVRRHRRVEAFTKVESYNKAKMFQHHLVYCPKYKHARGIYSRTIYFKVMKGPACKSMEQSVYHQLSRFFIKDVPQDMRPRAIYERLYLPGACYGSGDHVCFESSMRPEMMDICEMQLYSYMLQNMDDYETFMQDLHDALTERQDVRFSSFDANLSGRMSGEMVTSLGNAFTNLMGILYLAHKHHWVEPAVIVEGDDSVFRVGGELFGKDDFAAIGFDVEMEFMTELHESAFCQVVYEPKTFEPCISPYKAILQSCWTDSRWLNTRKSSVLLSLLKAKVMSLRCQAWSTPVIWAFGSRVEALLGNIQPKWALDEYHINVIRRCGPHRWTVPSVEMRELTQRVWGIPVIDQLKLEDYFMHIHLFDVAPPWVVHYFSRLANGTCYDYAMRYVVRWSGPMHAIGDECVDKTDRNVLNALIAENNRMARQGVKCTT